MGTAIRVGVVDDHPLYRAGVAATLQSADGFDIVGEGETADCALRIAHDFAPDLMLLDIHLPGGGLEAAARLVIAQPQMKVVVLTISEAERHISDALGANAWGYIVKGISGPELVRALREIYSGVRYVTPSLAARILMRSGAIAAAPEAPNKLQSLTERERVVIEHVRQGLTNKEVARVLKLSDKTVKHHMTSIMQKMHVRNRTELAIAAAGAIDDAAGVPDEYRRKN